MSSEADDPQDHVEEHESMSFANIVFTVSRRNGIGFSVTRRFDSEQVNNHRVRLPIQVFGDSDAFYSIVKKATDQCQDVESEVCLDLDKSEDEDFWRFVQFMNPRSAAMSETTVTAR
jgi:hypothetical protein